jgi:hypothetical protein
MLPLGAAVGRALNEPAFGAAGARMAEALAGDLAQDRALTELEGLVDGERDPSASSAVAPIATSATSAPT